MNIKEIMTRNVICADVDENILSVAKKMRDEKVGAIPVCNSKKLVGMITDRDIVTRVVSMSKDPVKITAKQVMTTQPVSSRLNETLEDAVHLMEDKRVRRLPVMDGEDHLVGILTLDDVARHSSHELTGEALEALSFALKGKVPPTARAGI